MNERFLRGDHTYGEIWTMSRTGNIRTGKYCSVGNNVRAIMVGHNSHWITAYPFSSREMRAAWPGSEAIQGHPRFMGDIEIGNDVWIGSDVLLLGGITIGNGAIIGAGSVVDKNVQAYAVVAGNRAQIIKYRFTDWDIEALELIQWWDWPEEKILENLPLLCSTDIGRFLQKHWRKTDED